MSDDQFISRKVLKRFKNHSAEDVVVPSDSFTVDVHGKSVEVSGEDVLLFARSIEQKCRQYLDKPFFEVLPDGILSKKTPSFKGYLLGTAICKHHEFDAKRFIEAQYYFHDSWKGSSPSLNYVTSLHSKWNSVGRYRSYCEKFKEDIDYFEKGSDNINPAFKSSKPVKEKSVSSAVLQHYEQMVQFQMESSNKTLKEVLLVLGHPERGYLPIQYLQTIPEYLQLIADGAWGGAAMRNETTNKLRLQMKIEN